MEPRTRGGGQRGGKSSPVPEQKSSPVPEQKSSPVPEQKVAPFQSKIGCPNFIAFRLTKLLRVRFPTQVPLIQLAEKLEFCGHKKDFKEHLQKNMRAISQADFEEIVKSAFELNPKFKNWYGTGAKLIRSIKRQSRIVKEKNKP